MHGKESSFRSVFVWSVNLAVEHGEPERNAAAAVKWIDRAAGLRKVPDLILFPEMCVSGYISTANRLREVQSRVEEALDTVLEASRKISYTVILIGYPYHKDKAISIRHSAIRNGSSIFHHDKLMLSPREKKVFTKGEVCRTFPVDVTAVPDAAAAVATVRCGILLCYENHFPELAAQLADEGCDIIFTPFATPRESPRQKYRRMLRFLPARAYDNSCFVVSCNLIQDFPRTGRSPGTAMIFDPKGRNVSRTLSKKESCCKAVLDLDEIRRIRKSAAGYFRGMKP
jgi:N-carbamoylputrescine amidase